MTERSRARSRSTAVCRSVSGATEPFGTEMTEVGNPTLSRLLKSMRGGSASLRLAEGEPVLSHAFVELELNRNVAVLPSIVVNEFVSCIVVGVERLIEVRR